jgi:hypothetical protein
MQIAFSSGFLTVFKNRLLASAAKFLPECHKEDEIEMKWFQFR